MAGAGPTLGILGVGHLGAALVRGFRRAGVPGSRILLSPRGDAVCAIAVETGCRMAPDLPALVAEADTVLLCVRPDQAREVLAPLRFRRRQLVVSALAAVPLAALAPLIAPARCVRAMPMTAAELGLSATALFPPDAEAEALLAPLGPMLPMAREEDLDIATAGAVLYSFARLAVLLTRDWLILAGLAPAAAEAQAAAHLAAAAGMMREGRMGGLDTLATRGGVAEAALAAAASKGLPAAWNAGFDAALARIRAGSA